MLTKCQNCGRRVFGQGLRDKLGIFCSQVCRNNVAHPGFCNACVAASTPVPAGSNATVNGIGITFCGRGDPCRVCGSVVQTQWFCFLLVPLVPLGRFRVKYVAPKRYLSRMVREKSDWKEIAENLKKAGWTWGCTERVDSNGQTIFVADAHREGKRYVVRGDNKAAAFVELQNQVRAACPSESFPSPGRSASKLPRNYPAAARILGALTGIVVIGLIGLAAWDDFSRRNRPHESQPEITKAIPVQPNELEVRKAMAAERYPWKTNIITTIFWIGEDLGKARAPRVTSAWDANWVTNYGGYDNPDPRARRNYIPIAFVPRQNPFYCSLPYNDVNDDGRFKPEASLVIPWFKRAYSGEGQSVCRHRWLAIRKGNRICCAEWEDCGPFRTDDFQYTSLETNGQRRTPSMAQA